MKTVDNKKFIGLDLDGVIINHAPVKIELAKKFGFKLKPEETPSEIMRRIIDEATYKEIQFNLYDNPKFFKTAPLMAGAKSGLKKLKDSSLPFALISRRKDSKSAIAVLKYHGLWPKFFDVSNTFFVVEPADKNVKAQELGVTHFADDEFKILEKLANVKNKFLFDNLDAFENIHGYTRVESWKELIGYFMK